MEGGQRGTAVMVGGRYQLDALIASGGMAEVWSARDALLDREVAVKLPLEPLRGRGEFTERFRREAVAAARLNHPRVVRVYDTGTDPDRGSFIVMELVEGPSLKTVMASGRLMPERAVELAAEVAQALDFAHRAGVVHRDIKPANVLVAADGAKVADFGIAKASERPSDMTETGVTLGTARYLSPEQVEGKPTDARTDVYSLGVVLYEMLCGQAPFDADTDLALALKHVTSQATRPSDCSSGVPDWLDSVVMTAIAKDPSDRFATAGDFRAALLSEGHDGAVPGPARQPAPAAARRPGRATFNGRDSAAKDRTTALPTQNDGPAANGGTGWARSSITALADTGSHAIDPAGLASQPVLRPRGYALAGLAIAAVLVAAGVGMASAWLNHRNASSHRTTAVTAPGLSSVQLPVAAAHSFNPPPGSGTEHEELVGNLIDGNPSTYWHTETYDNQSFGNLKSGVGVYLQLRTPSKVGDLVISSPDSGWAFQVYESSQAQSTLDGWGTSVAHGTVTGPTTSVALGGRSAGYVLVWITHLPPSDQVRIGGLSLFS